MRFAVAMASLVSSAATGVSVCFSAAAQRVAVRMIAEIAEVNFAISADSTGANASSV